MNKVYFGDNYPSCSDSMAEKEAEKLLDGVDIYTSNSLVIEAVQCLVKEGKLKAEETIVVDSITGFSHRLDEEGDFIDSNDFDKYRNRILNRLFGFSLPTGL